MGQYWSIDEDSSMKREIRFQIMYDKEAAQRALDEAEQHDRYLEECNDDRLNRLARANQAYSANRITYYELKYYEVMVDNAARRIPLRLRADLRDEVRLIPLMPSADAGMPHTRPGSIICYPDIARFFEASTLIHELWHVHQRQYHGLWTRVFQEWGWTEGSERLLPPRIEASRRYNPDTVDCPVWIFRGTWIPVPVFKDISRPRVDEVEIWFIHAKEGYHVRTIPDELRTEYPTAPISAFEHPREMAAYLLSEPDLHRGTAGFERLLSYVGQTALPLFEKQSASTK